ncbi:glycerophosphodiester phosphodiesterase domain-containing protein 5 isoform X1 [Hemicordylus capensis]|uniref:glycerophosphodiester phosphodiesterase domain-containing protein 5 isoform X1 n=1 Tax=Hemicordylus capensis TaxID=884348 RepID=UPI002303E630|nr:glycerophosphodiester phosphodiesterase domain-containing protein 5 isoform X1 [Hemicordylus capensis]XP_053165892.1 glycerophosphodiester phosphodiesterase domain-containing protein 5 isoform X1 [Hemicordylus capensis]XP_053165893.1 glycerophosphodiester phosphodiesterase domain-containing protein 5 isoform X1 [Hemicordylus capensis]XP_053165894.1 glycerophosphodiester phosphodiesterase domain-containing protein 5 isoform X1 [Hemicordylus capensis]
MVKHQPLQYYEPQLCLSCLTGIYGCRWKRYQRSHDDTTKWECLWFLILTFSFFLTLIWFYFWWEVHNDYNEINWFLYNRMGYWSDWTIPILVTTAVGFTYITALLILALCHIAVGQQMNLHWIHKIGLITTLITTVVTMCSVAQLWDDEWDMVVISLQATAPFLHIGALVLVTALSWLISGQLARTERATSQMLIFMAYFAVVLALYLVPLTIYSPCIMERKDLGPKPAIIGHRGAPKLAPENTLMSFQKAVEQKVYGVQADVAISFDGVPFLMHDRTLRRTTNVEEVFPELAYEHSSMFNWTDLERLNAGEWFLRYDPFWTVDSLSASDYMKAANQSVCKLADMLEVVKDNATLLLNLQDLPPDHPYSSTFINITLETVLESGIPQQAVMWLPNSERELVQEMAPGFQQTTGIKADAQHLRQNGFRKLNLRYTKVTRDDIRDYAAANLSVNLYVVNEPWLYSVLWCAGVQSVTSDNSAVLSRLASPSWLMTPDEYYLIWIAADIVSCFIIVGVFIFQNYHIIRWRMGSIRTYNPEQIMLSAAVRRSSRDVNIMKEKLIFSEINSGIEMTDELSLCSENGYANEIVTPMDHREVKLRID